MWWWHLYRWMIKVREDRSQVSSPVDSRLRWEGMGRQGGGEGRGQGCWLRRGWEGKNGGGGGEWEEGGGLESSRCSKTLKQKLLSVSVITHRTVLAPVSGFSLVRSSSALWTPSDRKKPTVCYSVLNKKKQSRKHVWSHNEQYASM